MRKEKEGVEEWKRKVFVRVKRNSPPWKLRLEIGSIHLLSVLTKVILVLKTRRHGPSDAMHHPSYPLRYLSKDICFISHGDQCIIYRPLTPRWVDIEKVALCSTPPTTKTKTHIIESRAMRFIKTSLRNTSNKIHLCSSKRIQVVWVWMRSKGSCLMSWW